MTPTRLTHLSDEELAHLADGVLSIAELGDIDAHLAACQECQAAVAEALRGLAFLAQASNPPGDMAQHARARRWALARDASGLLPEIDEDIAEVGGRGMTENLPDTSPDGDEDTDAKK